MADSISADNVIQRWSTLAGKVDQYLIQEFDFFEGEVKKHAVALIDKQSGSISAQINDSTLADALKKLWDNAGATSIDPAVSIATADQTVAVPAESRTVPSVVGPGYGVDNTKTTAAKTLDDLNNQPELKISTPSAQEQLSGKTVDVTDVTPAEGQSQSDAVKAATPEGTTAVSGGVPVSAS